MSTLSRMAHAIHIGGRTSSSAQRQLADTKRDYDQQVREFRERTQGLKHPGLEHYYWYHTVDLGEGLVTPGVYDFRQDIDDFGFPEDMTGLRVLDVGSATGFFAFEFERRGAEVVSVELPSLEAWDIMGAERESVIAGMVARHGASSSQEAYQRHLDGPFQFCRTRLGSQMRRCYSSVYDLTLANVGGEKFDLVYAGDILLHLFSPLKALDVLSGLCRGSLMVTVDTPFPGPAHQPWMMFLGGTKTEGRSWWRLSEGCFEHIAKRLGFPNVSVVGHYSGQCRVVWTNYSRQVIQASRS